MTASDRVIVKGSERSRGWPEIARKSENEREGPSNNAREREEPCDGQKYRESVGGSERGRVMTRNSEKEREGVREAVWWPEIVRKCRR